MTERRRGEEGGVESRSRSYMYVFKTEDNLARLIAADSKAIRDD